jgi:hypothetical protein
MAQVLLRDTVTVPDGVVLLEEALKLEAAKAIDPTLVAELQFLLAQGLVLAADPTAADRARARELAQDALAAYRDKAKHWGPQIAEIEAWMAKQDPRGPNAP